jgi:hypothetical protein
MRKMKRAKRKVFKCKHLQIIFCKKGEKQTVVNWPDTFEAICEAGEDKMSQKIGLEDLLERQFIRYKV